MSRKYFTKQHKMNGKANELDRVMDVYYIYFI